MARSSYVYLVVLGITPIAAFTVKHEMEAFYRKLYAAEMKKYADEGIAFPFIAPTVLRGRDGLGNPEKAEWKKQEVSL